MTRAIVASVSRGGYQRARDFYPSDKRSTTMLADTGRAFFTCTVETWKHTVVFATFRQLPVDGAALCTHVCRLFQTDCSG
jgi:hypothetical protein